MISKPDYAPFIFVHITRTGGSSIEKALSRIGTNLKGNKKASKIYEYPQHFNIEEYEKLLGNIDSYFKFTFVRSPFSRLYSKYSIMRISEERYRRRNESFNDYVSRVFIQKDISPTPIQGLRSLRPCMDWIIDTSNFSFIGRFENLRKDYSKIASRLNVSPSLNFWKKKTNNDNDPFYYRKFYSRESVEIVEKFFKSDLEEFNYEY